MSDEFHHDAVMRIVILCQDFVDEVDMVHES